jgi:N6-L-threonylcarbamoyladenine synthase/protein kinase Bud32
LSKRIKKPLIGVNHCVAHIEVGRLTTKLNDPVTLYVSGANTQVIAFVSGKYRIFGETQDIGIGNALDKFGREANLEFPYGPKIEKLAKGGNWIQLPYVVKGMDLSFSGIITEATKKLKQGNAMEDVCFSLQETTFAMLTEVVERAMAHTGKNEALLTGGVAANGRLQEMLGTMCRERGGKFAVVPMEYSGDNGAMIAWMGMLGCKSGQKPLDPDKAEILPRWRTDEVEVKWI